MFDVFHPHPSEPLFDNQNSLHQSKHLYFTVFVYAWASFSDDVIMPSLNWNKRNISKEKHGLWTMFEMWFLIQFLFLGYKINCGEYFRPKEYCLKFFMQSAIFSQQLEVWIWKPTSKKIKKQTKKTKFSIFLKVQNMDSKVCLYVF